MILRILASVLFVIGVASQSFAAVMEIGYCNGEVSSATVSKVGKCDVSAAIVLTPDVLSKYKGADIKGVRLYLATTENLEDLTAWVREDLNGDNLASASVQPVEGWQTVTFDTDLKVGDAPLAVGYTFNQTKSSKCITLGGDVNALGHYYAKKGAWEEIPAPSGSVCVELVVEGEMIPESDLEVVSLSLDSSVVKVGTPLALKAKVRNSSLTAVNGFSYALENVNQNHGLISGRCDEGLEPKQSVEIDLVVPTDGFLVNEEAPLIFIIEDDGVIDNNSKSISSGVYDEAFARKLLLEEFTTEQCPNCPRAINSISTALDNGYGEKMVVVAHHVGFYTDWLTIPEESQLLWFYGGDGSYAPAGMYNRTVRTPDLVTPVEQIGYYDTFGPRLDESVDLPGFVKVAVKAVKADDSIDVEVDAEAHPLLGILLDKPYITVLLTEDGIRHHSQAGIGNPDFTHSHASRAYLTAVMGDAVEFDEDGSLHWSASIPSGPDWNVDNMEAVAFIHAYDPDDRTACQVFNAASCHLSVSGVDSVMSESGVSVEYFDLQGRRLSEPCKGVTLIRRSFSDGTVRSSKMVR